VQLRFPDDELAYLRGLRFMKSDFVDFLVLFSSSTRSTERGLTGESPAKIDLTIRGPVAAHILYEIPVLAIVSEVGNFRRTQARPNLDEGRSGCRPKIELVRKVEPSLELQDLRLRHAAGALRAPGRRRWLQKPQAEVPEYFAGNVERCCSPCATHHAPSAHGRHEIHAGLPGAGAAAAADSQVFAFDSGPQEYAATSAMALSENPTLQRLPVRTSDMYSASSRRGAPPTGRASTGAEGAMSRTTGETGRPPRARPLIFSDQLSFPLAIESRGPLSRPRRILVRHRPQTSPTTSATSRSTSCSR